jgi:hypothetical protein
VLGFGTPFARGLWTPAIVAILRQTHPSLTLLPVALAVMNDLVTDTLARLLDTAVPLVARKDDSGDDDDDELECLTASHVSVVNAGLALADGSLDASYTVKLYHKVDLAYDQAPGTAELGMAARAIRAPVLALFVIHPSQSSTPFTLPSPLPSPLSSPLPSPLPSPLHSPLPSPLYPALTPSGRTTPP